MNGEKEIGCCNLEERRCGAGGAMYSGVERSGASNEYVATASRCGALRRDGQDVAMRCDAWSRYRISSLFIYQDVDRWTSSVCDRCPSQARSDS